MLQNPSRLIELLNLMHKKKFYVYINKNPIVIKRTKRYLIAFFMDPTLKGSLNDHVTLKIDYNAVKILDIHRTIRTEDINKRIIVDMNYITESNGFSRLLSDLKYSQGSFLQKYVVASMYLLLRQSYFEGDSKSSIDVPTKDEAIKLRLKYPSIVVETTLMHKIIFNMMMQITRTLNRKNLWKYNAQQVPGYKTDVF